jgi:hypothetical protein
MIDSMVNFMLDEAAAGSSHTVMVFLDVHRTMALCMRPPPPAAIGRRSP